MADDAHSSKSSGWLIFFFICFVLVMLGWSCYAIFFYNANAPEPKPHAGHGGMLLPQDGQYAPHVQVRPSA